MTGREKWMLAGLILLGLLLPGLWFWQQVRYGDAERAVGEYVKLEQRAAAEGAEGPEAVKKAQEETRALLARGEFDAALKRIQAMHEEADHADDPEILGKGVPVAKLWPEKSAEREKARQVLRLLVERQKAGYEIGAAQEALVLVADQARRGKKKEALEAFAQVEAQLRNAPLRPGFKAPKPQAAGAGPAGVPAAPGAPPIADADVARALQFFHLMLPRLLEQPGVPEEQKRLLIQVKPLGDELAEAHRQRRDLRPILPLLDALGRSIREQDRKGVDRLLSQARALIRTAKPLPPGAAPVEAPPPGGPGTPPAGSPPSLPPAAPGGPGGPAGDPAEGVLRALDFVRRLPEEQYQQQRRQLAPFIAQAIMQAGRPGGRPGGLERGPRLAVGEAGNVRLVLGSRGEVRALRAGALDLSEGLEPGGFSFAVGEGPEAPLLGETKQVGETVTGTVRAPRGTFVATYKPDGKGLLIHTRARRDDDGEAGVLTLRLPVRAAGWRWDAGAEPQVMAVDGRYEAAASGGKLPPVTLRGPGVSLTLTAPTAASLTCDPSGSTLIARFPVPKGKGATEHVLRLSLGAGGASEVPGGE